MSKKLQSFARELRKGQTPSEAILWSRLRDRRFFGLKFARQFPIDPYIVDFCCRAQKLVIEVDGGGHDESKQRKYDDARDTYLRQQGYTVLRYWSNDVTKDIDVVLEDILNHMNPSSLTP